MKLFRLLLIVTLLSYLFMSIVIYRNLIPGKGESTLQFSLFVQNSNLK